MNCKKPTLDNVMNCLGIATVIVGFVLTVTLVFWHLWPYNPLEVADGALPILDKEITRDENIIYRIDFCKNTDLPVTIKRRIKDGIIWSLPDVHTYDNKMGCKVLDIAIPVPHSLPSGEYIMTVDFEYEMNPIRTVVVEKHTEKFEIL